MGSAEVGFCVGRRYPGRRSVGPAAVPALLRARVARQLLTRPALRASDGL